MSAASRRGLAAAAGAYILWGALPIYLNAAKQVPTLEIVANRILWSAVLVGALVLLRGQGRALLVAVRARRTFWTLVGSTLCISINWGAYAWAIPHGHTIDAGFGYLINPLVTVLLGVVVLREHMRLRQWVAVGLATMGVAVLVSTGGGGAPWVAIVLPISFGLYGLLRKTVAVDALLGLAVEVLLLAPLAAIWIGTRPEGGALFGQSLGMAGLMLLAGPMTAVPLVLFAYGARRMPLTMLGQLQYASPTLQFLVATLILGERFTWMHALSIAFIWAGIAVYAMPVRAGRNAVDKKAAKGHIASGPDAGSEASRSIS